MTAYTAIYLLCLCGVPLSLVDDSQIRKILQAAYFSILLVSLTLFAGLRSPYVDGDSFNYIERFNRITVGAMGLADWLKDPAFAAIALMAIVSGLAYVFVTLIFAALALSAQLTFAYRMSSNRWITLFFYLIFCRFYIVGEMNQITAAVAIPLMSLSIYWACHGHTRNALFIYFISVMFHISSLLGLPILILLLMGVEFRSRKWVLSLVPLTLLAYILLKKILQGLSGYARFYRYVQNAGNSDDLHVLSVHLLMHLLIVVWVLIFWKKLSLYYRVATICASIGISLFVLFISVSAVAYRFEDVFDLFWIVLLVCIAERLRGTWRLIYFGALMILGFGLFYVSTQDIQPYMLWMSAH